MKKVRTSRGLQFRWIVSYLLAFMIPLFTSVVLFINIDAQIESRKNASNFILLETISSQNESWANESQKIVFQLFLDKEFRELAEAVADGQVQQRYLLCKYLQKYFYSMNQTDEVIFMEREHGIAVSNKTALTIQLYYNCLKDQGYTGSYEDFCELFLRSSFDGYVQVRLQDQYRLFYIASDSSGGQFGNWYIVVEMSQAGFANNIKSLVGETEDFMLVNTNGEVLFSLNRLCGQMIPAEILASADEKPVVYKTDRQNYLLYVGKKNFGDFRTVYMVKKQGIFSGFLNFRLSAVLSLVLCIILWISYVLQSVKKNYEPVRNILNMIRYKGDSAKEKTTSGEYALIKDALSRAYQTIDEINSDFDRNKKFVYYNLLYSLMNVNISNEIDISDELLKSNGIVFEGDCFCVVIFRIEDISDLFTESNMSATQRMKSALFIVDNILTELMKPIGSAYGITLEGYLAMLVNPAKNEEENVIAQMKEICHRGMTFIYENFRFTFHAVVGDIVHGRKNIYISYQSALNAYGYCRMRKKEMIMASSELEEFASESNASYYYSVLNEEKLKNGIIIGNSQKINEVIDSIFDALPVESNEMADKIWPVIEDIRTTIHKVLEDAKFLLEPDKLRIFIGIDNLRPSATVEETKEELKQLMEELCSYPRNKSEEENEMLDKIIDYINNNYSNCDLNVAEIARHFCFSPNYLSHFFKSKTGEGLLNYISKIRIEVAKEMIRQNPDVRLEKVSKLVGYNSRATFSRVFTKSVGVAPQKWRDIIMNQK